MSSSTQDLRRRLRSVRNTRQITKAMQLVAASKLRKAEDAAKAPVSYNQALTQVLGGLQSAAKNFRHPLYQPRPVRRGMIILVAADRGLAGAYNANVLRLLRQHVRQLGVPQTIVSVGRNATDYAAKDDEVDELAAFETDAGDADSDLARPILAEAVQLFLDGEIDRVDLIYTHFVSTIKQEALVEQLLPAVPAPVEMFPTLVEPSLEAAIDLATRRLCEGRITQAILESRASEQAARMLAMLNATNNANDLINDLNLAYNEARQSAITAELADITGGTEALADA